MHFEVFKLYPDRDDVTLTSYVVADSPELIALRFAAMGYHAFVLRYSVYYEGKRPQGFGNQTGEMPALTTVPCIQCIGTHRS